MQLYCVKWLLHKQTEQARTSKGARNKTRKTVYSLWFIWLQQLISIGPYLAIVPDRCSCHSRTASHLHPAFRHILQIGSLSSWPTSWSHLDIQKAPTQPFWGFGIQMLCENDAHQVEFDENGYVWCWTWTQSQLEWGAVLNPVTLSDSLL